MQRPSWRGLDRGLFGIVVVGRAVHTGVGRGRASRHLKSVYPAQGEPIVVAAVSKEGINPNPRQINSSRTTIGMCSLPVPALCPDGFTIPAVVIQA